MEGVVSLGERGDQAYWDWSESSEKFDYYICGLVAAVIVFAVKDLDPEPIAFSVYGLKLASVVSLLLGVILGLKRVESTTSLKLLQHRRLNAQEFIGALRSAPSNEIAYNKATGQTYTFEERQEAINKTLGELEQLVELESARKKKALRYYKWRNRALVAGVVGLLVGVVLNGYSAQEPPVVGNGLYLL